MPKLTAIADDMSFELEGVPSGWQLTLHGASDESIKASGSHNAKLDLTTTLNVTNDQAAAIVALFIAGDMENDTLTVALYEIAEPALAGIKPQLRPIP